MTIRDVIKFTIKLIVAIYVCAVLLFIIFSVSSGSENSILDAFSPVKIFNEITSGNSFYIITVIIGTVFIMRFNYFRKKKVDYEDGGRVWPWPK
jgi:hypothetical protein